MKHSSDDNLYEYFERHLFETEFDEGESQVDFVQRVVEDYCTELCQAGMICAQHLQQVQADLEEEVTEMLQKKIYGYFSLKQFRLWNSNKREA